MSAAAIVLLAWLTLAGLVGWVTGQIIRAGMVDQVEEVAP